MMAYITFQLAPVKMQDIPTTLLPGDILCLIICPTHSAYSVGMHTAHGRTGCPNNIIFSVCTSIMYILSWLDYISIH